jgi:hypothetical protein
MVTTGTQTEASRRSAEYALQVSDRVEIREVILVAAGLSRTRWREGVSLNVDVQRRARATMDRAGGVLRVQADLTFVAREPGAAQEPNPIEVRATYELMYAISEQSDLTQEHFDAFAEMNGVFNAWPYFREFLNSSLVRMGLPPFTLPVLRVGTASTTRQAAPSSD